MSKETFDKTRLYRTFSDIERYFGYLKGNELAYDYLERARREMDRAPQGDESAIVIRLEGDYTFPCPEFYWRVNPDESVRQFGVAAYVSPHEPEPGAAVVRQIQAYADEAWHDGASWAGGLADYLFSLCERFAEPDVPALFAAVEALDLHVVDPLGGAVDTTDPNDPLELAYWLVQWHGQAAAGFHAFYTNYAWHKRCWGAFASYTATGFMVATQIIDKTQRGAQKYADSLKSALEDQLTNWVRWTRPPEDPPQTPAWVAKVGLIASDAYALLDDVPLVNTAKGAVDKLFSIKGKVEKLGADLGLDISEHEIRSLDARTAEEMYTEATRTLRTEYDEAYWDAMHGLLVNTSRKGKVRPFSGQRVLDNLHELEKLPAWTPRAIPRASLYDPARPDG